MRRAARINILYLLTLVMVSFPVASVAGDLSLWDSAVNRLLAAGLYGVDLHSSAGTALQLEQGRDLLPRLLADRAHLSDKSITLSYKGSSGLLGFSAGYIYTSGDDEGTVGSVYLGLDDPMGFQAAGTPKAWYLALDITASYQPYDTVSLGVVGKTLFLDDSRSIHGGQMFSFLLNMPVSYKKYITITPELQWSRPLSGGQGLSPENGARSELGSAQEDVFYSGVSISFSY